MAPDRALHRAAVLGLPVSHSLSPRLHTAGYAALGLSDWTYTAIDTSEEDLVGFVDGLDASWRGLSLTMPLKERAFAVAERVTDVARQARAINTLIRRGDGRWDADNTDVHGIVESLRHTDHGGRAVLIGAGATARSAVIALDRLGVSDLVIAARRPTAGETLADFARTTGMAASVVPLDAWAQHPPPLVVSTVPVGAGEALVASAQSVHGRMDLTLFDVVYAPWPSPLAAVVQAAGGAAISGLEMLIHQAALQFELFTGHPIDVSVMRAAVEDRA